MITNSQLKELSELREKEGRRKQKRFLIEGKRSVADALEKPSGIRQIFASLGVNSAKFSDIAAEAERLGIELSEIPANKFNKLTSTETSQGIVAVADIPETNLGNLISGLRSSKSATVILLDRISDPGNLGTIFRSAAWFGAKWVVVAEGSVDSYNPKVVRSAMSAIPVIEIVQDESIPNALIELKKIGFSAIASTQSACDNYTSLEFPGKTALVFGSEAAGLSKDVLSLCDRTVCIPGRGKMESLNVAVAASIVLAEISRQHSVRHDGAKPNSRNTN